MALSDADEQLLFQAFCQATAQLGSVEQRLAALFKHTIKSPEEQATERAAWLAGLIASQADALAKHDANVEATRRGLQRGLDDLQALQATLTTPES